MNTHRNVRELSGGELGRLLRHWRDVRGKSQIDLSLDTGVSQRHISFIESGRSAPSRHTLTNITQALSVPFRDRNELFVAAGYAPIHKEDAWNSEELAGVKRALDRMLLQHEPFPSIVMDRHWNVFMRNVSARRFFGAFVDLDARSEPRNLLHLLFDPAGMRPFIANWDEASNALIQRIHREAVGHTLDERTQELLAALREYEGADTAFHLGNALARGSSLPMVPLSFQKDGQVLRYFSMITTVGTPQTITTQELRIESMFPVDDATEVAHRQWMDRLATEA
jgi:transcriptional regulator with XRE-family HTH domain